MSGQVCLPLGLSPTMLLLSRYTHFSLLFGCSHRSLSTLLPLSGVLFLPLHLAKMFLSFSSQHNITSPMKHFLSCPAGKLPFPALLVPCPSDFHSICRDL